MAMDTKIDSTNKWDVYKCIAADMAKKHTMEELSSWLSDLSSELAQWSLRCACHGTPYKKSNIMTYIEYMAKTTQLLMAVHHKIKEDDEELYDVIEKGVMHSFYNDYCEE